MKRIEMYETMGAVPFPRKEDEDAPLRQKCRERLVKKIIFTRLTDRQKQVIVLYYYYRLRQKEIALRLGISEAAVSACKKRALRELQFYLDIDTKRK